MAQVLKVALPGYNALTDTNLDHFSLNTDGDNVLIKEFTRGSTTVSSSEVQITHNLNYIPLFFVFVYRNYDQNGWVTPYFPNFSVDYYIYADTTKLYFNNVTGTSTTFKYYIFYDTQVGSSTNVITESKKVMKIAKQNIDASTSKDPNDYIFHSDLNTFKIIKEVETSVSVTGGGGTFTLAHGLVTPASYSIFFKFTDGVVINGVGENANKTQQIYNIRMDDTNIKFQVSNTPNATYTLYIKYYIYETPLS